MIFFGTRTLKIKKYDDYNIQCENCGNFHQRFQVYQQCFHVMLIPTFPLSLKTIRCSCTTCNDQFNEVKKNDYLKRTRTPLFLYTGSLIIACLIIFVAYKGSLDQKLKTEYVNNPLVGDVYQIGQDEKYGKAFYFVKIMNINSDTIEFLHGALQYNSYVGEMSDADYFVKDDVWRLLKTDVINYLDSGYIYSVDREYEPNSRFNIEQN